MALEIRFKHRDRRNSLDMNRIIIITAICILAVFPLMSKAETYQVSVENNFFNPNDIVIQPGDTVVWRYTIRERDCPYGCPAPVLHNVVADDQSFSSGPPSEDWTFQQTFDQLGEILYHCGAHSAAGRDINSFMNGRITVQDEIEAAFAINRGLSDAWYNPATNGQGFLIMVFPEIQQMFLAWFTYDTERPPEDVSAIPGEPGHRWLTAQGPYDGDTANLTIFMTEGGVFDAAAPSASTDPGGDGSMTLEFADCTAGLVHYEITSLDISGDIPIQRIVPDNVPLCLALANP